MDRWSEDWTDLAWLRLRGRAVLVEPPLPTAILEALLARYPQYASHDLRARPAIRIQIERVITWMASADTR